MTLRAARGTASCAAGCFFNALQARRADYFGVIPAHFFRRTAERLLLSQLRSSKVLFLFGRALKTQFPVCSMVTFAFVTIQIKENQTNKGETYYYILLVLRNFSKHNQFW